MKMPFLNVKCLLWFYQCKLLFGTSMFIHIRQKVIISKVNYSHYPALHAKSSLMTINNEKIVF